LGTVKYGEVAERFIALFWKSRGPSGSGSSNLPFSAEIKENEKEKYNKND
jgi:hypothetical protein